MTAGEIIDEIQHLDPSERERVISFVRGLEPTQRMTGRELSVLAAELAQRMDATEAERLKERIAEGFYGGRSHA